MNRIILIVFYISGLGSTTLAFLYILGKPISNDVALSAVSLSFALFIFFVIRYLNPLFNRRKREFNTAFTAVYASKFYHQNKDMTVLLARFEQLCTSEGLKESSIATKLKPLEDEFNKLAIQIRIETFHDPKGNPLDTMPELFHIITEVDAYRKTNNQE